MYLTNGKLLKFQIELLENYDKVYLDLEKLDVIITYIKTLMNTYDHFPNILIL